MQSAKDYAQAIGASERSVKRWLADDQLPGAVMVNGKWMIPSETVRQVPLEIVSPAENRAGVAGSALEAPQAFTAAALAKSPTLADYLAHEPAYVPLATASRYLGISEYAIRQRREEFQLEDFGAGGSTVMPVGVIRTIAGAF